MPELSPIPTFPGTVPSLPQIDEGDARDGEGIEEWNLLTRLGAEITEICTALGTNPGEEALLENFASIKERLEKQGSTFVNVKGYGIDVGVAGTDSTTAIVDAISLASGNGGVVFFPPGVYDISTTITVPSNVFLVGSGIPKVEATISNTKGTYLRYMSNTNPCILFEGASSANPTVNAGLRQMGLGAVNTYFGNSANSIGISCIDSSHLSFVDVHIHGFGVGIKGYELTNSVFSGDWAVRSGKVGIKLESTTGTADTHHVYFRGGRLHNLIDQDIFIQSTDALDRSQQPSHIKFHNLNVSTAVLQGGPRVRLTSTSNVTFDSCTFNWSEFGGAYSTPVDGFVVEEGSVGFTLSDCTFVGDVDATIDSFVKLDGTTGSSLLNNKWVETNAGPEVAHIEFVGANLLLTESGNGWASNGIPGSDASHLTRAGAPLSVAYVRRNPFEVRGAGDGETDQGDEIRAVAAAASLLTNADDPVTIYLEGVVAASLKNSEPAADYGSIVSLGSNVRLMGNGRLICLPRSGATPAMGDVSGSWRTTNQLITNLNVDSSAPFDSNIQVLAGPAGFVIDGNSSAHFQSQSIVGGARTGNLTGSGDSRTLSGTSLTGLTGYTVKFSTGQLARITAVAGGGGSCTVAAIPGSSLPANNVPPATISYEIHNTPLLHGVRFYYAKDLLVGDGVVVQDCIGVGTDTNGYGVSFSNCNAVTDLSTVRWTSGPGFSGKGATNSAVVKFGGRVFDVPYIGVADFISNDVIVETATQNVKSIHALTQNSRHVRYTSAAKIGVGSTDAFLPITASTRASTATHGIKVVHEKRTGPVTIDADIQNITNGTGVEVIGPEPLVRSSTANTVSGTDTTVTVTGSPNTIVQGLLAAEDANGWYTFSGWVDPALTGATTGPHRIKAGNGTTTLVMELGDAPVLVNDEIILGLDPIRIGGNITGCTTGVAIGTSDSNAKAVHASQVIVMPGARVVGNTTDLANDVIQDLPLSSLRAGGATTLTYDLAASPATLTVDINAAEAARLSLTDHTMAIVRDEFFSGVVGTGNNWASRTSGTGSGRGSEPSVADHPGILEHLTGTTSNGFCQSDLGVEPTAGSGDAGFDNLHEHDWVVDMIVNIPLQSSAADEFIVRCGLGDSVTATEPDNGFYFEYVRSGSDHHWIGKTVSKPASTRGESVTASAGSATAITNGTWYRLAIAHSLTPTPTVTFYVKNGAGAIYTVGSSTTNITTNPCGLFFGIYKDGGTTGTTSRSLLVDYVCFAMTGLDR